MPAAPAATYDAVAPAGTIILVAATLLNGLVPSDGAFALREVIVVREVHSENAKLPIELTLMGMVILLRLVQDWKALFPTEVTLLGIAILVILAQPRNA